MSNRMWKCKKCTKELEQFGVRCDECEKCDMCDGRDDLIYACKGLYCQTCWVNYRDKIAGVDTFSEDTSFTHVPKCPYCGAEEWDWWELAGNDDEYEAECGRCEYLYHVDVIVTVEFTTIKMDS